MTKITNTDDFKRLACGPIYEHGVRGSSHRAIHRYSYMHNYGEEGVLA
jgi:hypothetical protein